MVLLNCIGLRREVSLPSLMRTKRKTIFEKSSQYNAVQLDNTTQRSRQNDDTIQSAPLYDRFNKTRTFLSSLRLYLLPTALALPGVANEPSVCSCTCARGNHTGVSLLYKPISICISKSRLFFYTG